MNTTKGEQRRVQASARRLSVVSATSFARRRLIRGVSPRKMTPIDTQWMSIDVPEGFRGSVERAEIVIESMATGNLVRVAALRKDVLSSITMDDAKRYAVGGDKEELRPCDEKTFSNQTGYFSSRTGDRHMFSTVIGDTLMLLSSDGFDRAEAESTFEAVMTGLTIKPNG